MRLLLDTHAMYWYIEGDLQLSTTLRALQRGPLGAVHLCVGLVHQFPHPLPNPLSRR